MVKKTSARLQNNGSANMAYSMQDQYLDDIIGGDAEVKDLTKAVPPEMMAKRNRTNPKIGGKEERKRDGNDAEAEESSDEDFFSVEKILDKRVKGKRVQYLVKWEGYSEDQNTWEPLSNLRNVKDLVQEYERKLSEKAADAGMLMQSLGSMNN